MKRSDFVFQSVEIEACFPAGGGIYGFPSSVVGRFTTRMPRLNVAAANPPMSVISPPPTLTITL